MSCANPPTLARSDVDSQAFSLRRLSRVGGRAGACVEDEKFSPAFLVKHSSTQQPMDGARHGTALSVRPSAQDAPLCSRRVIAGRPTRCRRGCPIANNNRSEQIHSLSPYPTSSTTGGDQRGGYTVSVCHPSPRFIPVRIRPASSVTSLLFSGTLLVPFLNQGD